MTALVNPVWRRNHARRVLVAALLALFSGFLGLQAHAGNGLVGKPHQAAPAQMAQAERYCFGVVNRAPYTVYAHAMNADRDRWDMRLESGKGRRICLDGQLYPGQRVYFVIKTLIPIFYCHTKIDQTIVIRGRIKPEGGTDTYIQCR